MNKKMTPLPLPRGFTTAGIAAGIKKDCKDMALIVSDTPATSAAVYTTNQIKAAPVKWDCQVVKRDTARAIVMNSGNANACTGPQGKEDCEIMATRTAELLGTDPMDIFVCSTGSIGKLLPMDPVKSGIDTLCKSLSADNGHATAEAMMTTDLAPKTRTETIVIDGKTVQLTGLAKGSGMIEPNMATMLAYIITDLNIEKHALQCALRAATDISFNRISVDGDQSTNDSVIALANGQAENDLLTPASNDWDLFTSTLEKIMFDLAMMIVKDGEGATRTVTVQVRTAATNGEANEAARAVANSMLNKTAWAGTRPNWGRIMDAIGYSHAQVQEDLVDIAFDDIQAVKGGLSTNAVEADLVRAVSKEAFTINIDLNLGNGEAVVYTCNCTENYVKINVD